MSTATLDIPSQAAPPHLNGAAATAVAAAVAAAQPQPSPEATRVYRGRTIEELLPKIQAELGADAVVVRREKGLAGGFAGFFQRPFVEIEARRGTPVIDCYDDAQPALPEMPGVPATALGEPPAPAIAPGATPEPTAATGDEPLDDLLEEFRELTPAIVLPHTSVSNGATAPVPVHDDYPFAAALAEAETAVVPQMLHMPAAAAAPPSERTRTAIERALAEVGVGEELMRALIEQATTHVLPLMGGRPSLARAVHAALSQRIPACAPLPAGSATIAVVGAGGAGKSALCAALLGAYRRRSTLPAACATLSTEPNPATKAALREARAQGVLLLDTPACSPADPAAIRALAAQLQALQPDRVVVALPATLGERPAAQLLAALAPLKASALAITHVDETNQLGVGVGAACAYNIGPAYLLGQAGRERATGGLTPTDPAHLADRLLPPR